MKSHLGALLGVTLLLGQPSFAQFAEDVFWIVSHGPLLASRLDPIVDPGDVSKHVHAVVGGSNFGPLYDYDNSLKSECTTANVAVDMSNYWVPQLYNKHANGTLSIAGLSYVQTCEGDNEPVYEFPPGFRMLAGSANRDFSDLSNPEHDAVRYVCLGGTTPEGHEFPKERCKDGLRAQVYFPHCWDGINNWLEGSKHVSYGEGRFDGGGQCPPTHPKRIMGLFYEFIFHDHMEYTPGGRVWANGDTTGFSFHGDFTNGWPEGFFSEIFSYGRECSVGFTLENCPPLAKHLVRNQKCEYKGTLVDEAIGDDTMLTALPGNNPIWPTKRSETYVETAQFIENGQKVAPVPTSVPSVPAGEIRYGPVKGDDPYTLPPDAIPQAGTPTTTATPSGSGMDASPTAPPSLSQSASFVSGSASSSSTPSALTTLVAVNLAADKDKEEKDDSASPSQGSVTGGDASPTASLPASTDDEGEAVTMTNTIFTTLSGEAPQAGPSSPTGTDNTSSVPTGSLIDSSLIGSGSSSGKSKNTCRGNKKSKDKKRKRSLKAKKGPEASRSKKAIKA